ncbi:hypothetical protein GTP41_01500 [Pseudoduganella sp. DS3]|uniref:Acyltransferase family protein n=1 Tax=Pseudoduganella guangdongensis TaxID=2692179 RepID=A0A6N9HBF2_9BURK|nr:hypothetical protein [Pseudoduganella guangdongensis]MYN00766.1 hypothetical protein [Pseudoduganella guangdongensis]
MPWRACWIYAPLTVFAIATVDPLNAPLDGLFFVGAFQLILKERLLPPEVWSYFPYASGAILLVWVAVGDNAVSRFLSSKPLRWLGHKSFSLYLLHSFMPASVGMAVYSATAGMDFLARVLLSTAAVLASSAAVSVLFARYVDDASVRIANRYAQFAYARNTARTVTFGESFTAGCK